MAKALHDRFLAVRAQYADFWRRYAAWTEEHNKDGQLNEGEAFSAFMTVMEALEKEDDSRG